MSDFDIDENLISTISSRCYDLNEMNKIKLNRQSFSVFHTNIRSLSQHFDELHTQLNMLNIPFDIIGISESKQQVGKDFLVNVQMDGYSMYSQPSKSSCGGCVLYVNSMLNHHMRDDLSVIEYDYETIWFEINNYKSKHLLCCCLYRYPSCDFTNFNNHISSILQKVQKENKSLLIMGDFNINLVNYDSHPETIDFINLMVSHYLLPHILQPTRVTDHSATIIDNIFFNTLEFDTLSGNLLTKISYHFPQFLVVKNAAVDHKNCSLFQYDYSKFSEHLFPNDSKKLSWEDIVNQNSNINVKLDRFYEKVYCTVIHHAPLKTVNKKQLKLGSKQWVTPHIQKLIKHRDKLLRK